MADLEPDSRLSQVQTLWTMICRAHGDGSRGEVHAAQEQLMARYRQVVYRYLLGALRDADAAEELSQEFALRFVRGELKGANPKRGRFRDFLKGVLFHLIADYHRRRQRSPAPLPEEHDPADPNNDQQAADAMFLESWRAELLDRSWKALASYEASSGKPYFRVLRLRSQQPDMRSEAMAQQLTADLGRPIAATWVRQNLHRAREQFAEILFEEIRQTLVEPSVDEIEQELAAVGLHAYCKPMLEKLRDNP